MTQTPEYQKKIELEEQERVLKEPILRESPGGSFTSQAKVFSLVAGGSDRLFYRIQEGDRSVILLEDSKGDDFFAYIQLNLFFSKNFLPVPLLYAFDFSSQKALIEDLGDESLYHKVKGLPSKALLGDYYRKVINELITLQGISRELINECALLGERVFNYDQLRWETNYFTRYFLLEYTHLLSVGEAETLEEGYHHLAISFAHEPLFCMHRDFQSQNILWSRHRPYLIDFQGARQGPAAYDLASLLHDCYFPLEDNFRQGLISYYLEQREKRIGIPQEKEEFYFSYLRAALQRNMQALGAFVFLSLRKKKPWFEQFIPQGVRYLKKNLGLYPPLAILEEKMRQLPYK